MRKGYVTVFFTLVISLCLSMILGLITGVRENSMRIKIIESADVSMRSTFAEYQKELWERYDLLFVDGTYGYEMDSLFLTEEHFTETMNENLDEQGVIWLNGVDLLKLNCVNTEIDKIRFATDGGGKEIERQAVRCMKYKYGLKYLEDMYEVYKDAKETGLLEEESPYDNAEEIINNPEYEDNPVLKEWTAAEADVAKENGNLQNLMTLRKVLPDVSKISTTVLNEETLLSKRDLNEGNMEKDDSFEMADSIFLKEYFLEYCNNFLSMNPDTVLSYETEYLLKGDNADAKNMEAIANRILLVREIANLGTLTADTERMGEIEAFSEAAMSLLASPELAPVLEALIVAGWSYIESLGDVKTLLDGEKVPLIKSSDEWNSGITGLLSGDINQSEYEDGIEYKDYLRMFLFATDKEVLLERFMNICEINIKKDSGDDSFRLDYCFDAYGVTTYISSDYENDFSISLCADYGG